MEILPILQDFLPLPKNKKKKLLKIDCQWYMDRQIDEETKQVLQLLIYN